MVTDRELLSVLVDVRLRVPDRPRVLARARRAPVDWERQPLVLVAADHPARRTVAVSGNTWAMADRIDLLRRLARVLMQPFVDGILATPDIMEELWMLQSWVTSQGGPEFLAGKVLIGSMNRAGLTDTVFELDDFVSAYTPESLLNSAMDAGKLLLRLDPSSELSSRTLRHVCEALIELDRVGLPVFLEPIPVPVSVDDLVRLIGVASALGPSSRHRWLKVPMVESFDRVSRATTCPLVLLGGPNTGPSPGFVNRVRTCLAAGPNVRGILMGRAVLYPGDGSDPREVMAQLASLIKGKEFKEVIQWEAL